MQQAQWSVAGGKDPATPKKEMQKLMNIAAKLRARRVESRNRRAVNRALVEAKTPAMREEILAAAQRQHVSR